MNMYGISVAQPFSQDASGLFERASATVSRGIEWIRNLPGHLKNHPKDAAITFFVINTIFCGIILYAADKFDGWIEDAGHGEELDTTKRIVKHVLLDVVVVGGSVYTFNMILQKLTQVEFPTWAVAVITLAAIAVRVLLSLSKATSKSAVAAPAATAEATAKPSDPAAATATGSKDDKGATIVETKDDKDTKPKEAPVVKGDDKTSSEKSEKKEDKPRISDDKSKEKETDPSSVKKDKEAEVSTKKEDASSTTPAKDPIKSGSPDAAPVEPTPIAIPEVVVDTKEAVFDAEKVARAKPKIKIDLGMSLPFDPAAETVAGISLTRKQIRDKFEALVKKENPPLTDEEEIALKPLLKEFSSTTKNRALKVQVQMDFRQAYKEQSEAMSALKKIYAEGKAAELDEAIKRVGISKNTFRVNARLLLESAKMTK